MTGVILSDQEQEEIYVLLKPRETALSDPLEEVLRRIESALFQRLTIGQIEALAARFDAGR
jgi:hypothetical protein